MRTNSKDVALIVKLFKEIELLDITCTDVITSQSDTINFGQVLISPNNLLTLNQSNTERYL